MSLKSAARLTALRWIGRTRARRAFEPIGKPQRILLIRPDHLGDLLLAIPAIQRARALAPDSAISLLVGPWNLEAAQHIAGVDDVATLDFPWFNRTAKRAPWLPYAQLMREAARFSRQEYDMAVVLRHDFAWGAALAARAGIPQRVGYALPECAPFLTTALPYRPRHEAAQALQLVDAALDGSQDEVSGAAFAPGFVVTPEEAAFAETWLAQHSVTRPLIALHPGAGAAVKLWRPERFAAVAERLCTDHGATVVLTGTRSEGPLINAVRAGIRGSQPLDLVGGSLGRLAAVLRRCDLALGVDSGVMHLAAAVGTPTVRLYGPVSTERFGPWGPPDRHLVVKAPLPCVPCDRLDFSPEELQLHPCVRAIEVEQVLIAADKLLSVAALPA